MRRLILIGLLACGCVGQVRSPRTVEPVVTGDAGDTAAGWRALVDGRSADARALFVKRVGRGAGGGSRNDSQAGADPLAELGLLEVQLLTGRTSGAVDNALAILAMAAGERPPETATMISPVAVATLMQLLDELGNERTAVEDRVLSLPRSSLPWATRLALAKLGDTVARRRGDSGLRELLARRAGCVKRMVSLGSLGRLPRLDLDGSVPAVGSPSRPAARSSRALRDDGCVIEVRSEDDRPSAELLQVDLDVPTEDDYQVVVAYPSEVRLAVDGGLPVGSGTSIEVPVRELAAGYHLTAGRHRLELRVATLGGRAELTALVLGGRDAVHFVSPSPGVPAGKSRTAPLVPLGRRLLASAPMTVPIEGGQGASVATTLARALTASQAGEIETALTLADGLAATPRFAVGLFAAAQIALDDPTRPSALARDAARGLLRAAVSADPSLARAWERLAVDSLDEGRGRDALEQAGRAVQAAPGWWPAHLVSSRALRARGFEHDADVALDRAEETSGGACALVGPLMHRADRRRETARAANLARRSSACDAGSSALVDQLRARGDLAGAERETRRRLAVAGGDETVRTELASLLLAAGRPAQAARELAALVEEAPRNPTLRVRLVDALVAAGDERGARSALTAAVAVRPDAAEVRRAARVLGVPLPLDGFRLDGREVIRGFASSGRSFDAPSVMLLDRTVVRVMDDGTQLVLTHNIVHVQSKDGVERWGELSVPPGAEVLLLRTHKPDGSTREPEEIAGKESVSLPDLDIGDYVEWETLETRDAMDAFPGGFLGDRFYFQSFDAPLLISELLLVTPKRLQLELDLRAGAPAPVRQDGPDGTVVTTLGAKDVPQLFAERAAVPADEFVPSVRASSGVSWGAWARFVRERMIGTTRWSPQLARAAAEIRAAAFPRAGVRTKVDGPRDEALAAAMVRWVTLKIEAVTDLRDPAGHALARGRGNRLAVAMALARELGLRAQPVLARPRTLAADGEPARAVDLEDFGDTLLRFDLTTGPVWVDLRLKHAAFGYLPPAFDGAAVLSLDDGTFGSCTRRGRDQRRASVTLRVDEHGAASAEVEETLDGWPALELAELREEVGTDADKLKREIEQRWVAVHFPGASLQQLRLDPISDDGRLQLAYRLRITRFASVEHQNGTTRLKIIPSFFRSQPGRRYAAEPHRRTTLMLGYDVPVILDATIELPSTAKLVERAAVRRAEVSQVVGAGQGYRFVEVRKPLDGRRLQLRREGMIPIERVAPTAYERVAAELRRVDAMERWEILAELPEKERQ